jgi:hypothetical protein
VLQEALTETTIPSRPGAGPIAPSPCRYCLNYMNDSPSYMSAVVNVRSADTEETCQRALKLLRGQGWTMHDEMESRCGASFYRATRMGRMYRLYVDASPDEEPPPGAPRSAWHLPGRVQVHLEIVRPGEWCPGNVVSLPCA